MKYNRICLQDYNTCHQGELSNTTCNQQQPRWLRSSDDVKQYYHQQYFARISHVIHFDVPIGAYYPASLWNVHGSAVNTETFWSACVCTKQVRVKKINIRIYYGLWDMRCWKLLPLTTRHDKNKKQNLLPDKRCTQTVFESA